MQESMLVSCGDVMGSSNLRQISKEVTKHVFDIKFLWELVGYFHHNGQLNLRCKPSSARFGDNQDVACEQVV